MNETRRLLRHFLAALAYRTQKALRGAPENFERLLGLLGVPWQPSTMSFSVSDGVGDFEYISASPNGLFAKRRHVVTPWFHRMVGDLARFNRAARELLTSTDGSSLGDWLERQRFPW